MSIASTSSWNHQSNLDNATFTTFAEKQTKNNTPDALAAILYACQRLSSDSQDLITACTGNDLIANFRKEDITKIKNRVEKLSKIEKDLEFKKEFTRQMVIGMARLEWVPDATIAKIYEVKDIKSVMIPSVQEILKKRHIGLIDCNLDDVTLSPKDRNLLIYTKLFLHEQCGNTIADSNMTENSKYYELDNQGALIIKPYGIASYRQAINCAYQMYQESFHGIPPEESTKRYIVLESQEDIENIYESWNLVLHDGSIINEEQKSHILSITRAIMHIQSHKRLDYTIGRHNPGGLITYEYWENAIKLFEKAFDAQMERESEIMRTEEIERRWIKNSEGENISRNPTAYNWKSHSRLFKNMKIGNNIDVEFSGRIKSFHSSVWKLINTPKYKHGKHMTDNGAVTFHTKGHENSCQVFMHMINSIDSNDLTNVKLDIKWDLSWSEFLEHIESVEKSEDGYSFRLNEESIDSFWIKEEKLKYLYKNKQFAKSIYEAKNNWESKKTDNRKTGIGYEEFKLIMPSGTEVQIRTKEQINNGNLAPIAHNELGERWHWIYDGYKWIEILLRLHNEIIPIGDNTTSNVIDHLVDNAMKQEEHYLRWKFAMEWGKDMSAFNPWYAIYGQLTSKNGQYDYFNADRAGNRKYRCKQAMYRNILKKYVIVSHNGVKYLVPIKSEKRYDDWLIEIYKEYMKKKWKMKRGGN